MVITSDQALFAAMGEEGFTRLVAAFYEQVKTDDILKPMYPVDDMDGSEERLRDFLIFRFGGSQRYIEKRGHPRMRLRHAPFHIDRAARDRWVSLMDNAMARTDVPDDVARILKGFFGQVADFLVNQPG